MKTEIAELIDRLADGKDIRDCRCGCDYCSACEGEKYQAPILISKLLKEVRRLFIAYREEKVSKLVELWAACDPTLERPLQSILAECEWGWDGCKVNCPEPWCPDCFEAPKQPEVRNLFELLLSLNLAE